MRNNSGDEVTEDEDSETVEARVVAATEHIKQGPNEDPAFPELKLGQERGDGSDQGQDWVLLLPHHHQWVELGLCQQDRGS